MHQRVTGKPLPGKVSDIGGDHEVGAAVRVVRLVAREAANCGCLCDGGVCRHLD